jgi:hypothetical protein
MRNLVQPPPSLYCDFCHGELRLKRIDPDGPFLELDTEIFVCAKCGHERSYRVSHDRYAAHTACNMPPTKVG